MADLNFVNRTLWTADNLDILRGMNSETIDLIYLDPPFNSNRNYAAACGQYGGWGGIQGHLDTLRPRCCLGWA